MEIEILEYPALVYKANRNNVFIANCIVKNLMGYGKTEEDAVNNLENALNQSYKDYIVRVSPMKELAL